MAPASTDGCRLTRENREILGQIPERWGRMDLLSRATLLAVGRTLRGAGLLDGSSGMPWARGRIGLIAGSRRGSLATDLAYAETLRQGADCASPALFSYTLPNIALAEAAIHYHLTGPVYSLLSDTPMAEAEATARLWLVAGGNLDCILAGETDALPDSGGPVIIADFRVVSPAGT
jgi:3-oxoacyl-(acyl-carrier-protein) synthase